MTENEEHLLSVASCAEITISKIYFDENGEQINLRPIQHTYIFRKGEENDGETDWTKGKGTC